MVTNAQINSSSLEDWELIVDKKVEKLPNVKQISSFDLSVSIDNNFLAVFIDTNNVQPHWVAGGYLNQIYDLPDFNLAPEQHFVTVNQIKLIRINKLTSLNYRLVYDPPKYFDDVHIKVWRYQGIETDLLIQDLINALQNVPINVGVDLSVFEAKLNTLEQKLDIICEKLSNLSCNQLTKISQKNDSLFVINYV